MNVEIKELTEMKDVTIYGASLTKSVFARSFFDVTKIEICPITIDGTDARFLYVEYENKNKAFSTALISIGGIDFKNFRRD